MEIENEIVEKFESEMHLTTDDDAKAILKKWKNDCKLYSLSSIYKTTNRKKMCDYFPMLYADAILADVKSID